MGTSGTASTMRSRSGSSRASCSRAATRRRCPGTRLAAPPESSPANRGRIASDPGAAGGSQHGLLDLTTYSGVACPHNARTRVKADGGASDVVDGMAEVTDHSVTVNEDGPVIVTLEDEDIGPALPNPPDPIRFEGCVRQRKRRGGARSELAPASAGRLGGRVDGQSHAPVVCGGRGQHEQGPPEQRRILSEQEKCQQQMKGQQHCDRPLKLPQRAALVVSHDSSSE
jgi:hypothetical protein